MKEREYEINTTIQIIEDLLKASDLTLGTKEGVPVIIKDEKTGKLYGIVRESEQE